MAVWISLNTGVTINLDMIEAVVPVDGTTFRFFPPRTQRGGRPVGRPVASPTSYNEDRGYWEGIPTDPAKLTTALG